MMNGLRTTPIPVPPLRRQRGFTLIELMIAIVVLGIIAAVAFPSYLDSVRKSRRAEAFQLLSKIQLAQERWRGSNPQFSTDPVADLKVFPAVANSPYYTYTVAAPAAATLSEGYVAVAVGQSGQDADRQCSSMGVQIVDGNITYAGCGGQACVLVYDTHNICWGR